MSGVQILSYRSEQAVETGWESHLLLFRLNHHEGDHGDDALDWLGSLFPVMQGKLA